MEVHHNIRGEDEYDQDEATSSPIFLITSAILISLLIFFAISGNIITIIAYMVDKRLNTVYDLFIFNLAVTDLLIGAVSMPFYAVYTLKEFVWVFGHVFCKIWLVIDYTLCLESVLLILILSQDRLMLVSYGPFYSGKVTKMKARLEMLLSWVISFLLFGPAIIAWDYWSGQSIVEPLDCDVEFAHNVEFTTASAVVEFAIPVAGLTILNTLIYRRIRRQMAVSPRNEDTYTTIKEKGKESAAKCVTCAQVVVQIKNGRGRGLNLQEKKNREFENKCGRHVNFEETDNRIASNTCHCRKSTITLGYNCQKGSENDAGTGEIKATNMHTHRRMKRDNKAARFLAILVLTFLCCWAPYTVATVILSFCGGNCISTNTYEFMSWLLWSKSAINPFLYAMNSSRYRYHFKKYLMCWKRKIRPIDTETTFQTAG